jgi:hypothetical protein
MTKRDWHKNRIEPLLRTLRRLRFAKQKDELSEELRAHARMAMADRMERGESEEAAQCDA